MSKSYFDYAITDLHLHLDGALSSEIIIKIAKEEGINLPTYNPQELNKYLSVNDNCKSLNEYLEKFDLPNLVLQTRYGLKEATNDLLSRLAKDGLKYVEIRMAPQLSTKSGLSQDEVVETLLEVINHSDNNYHIKSRLILCMMRGADKSKNIDTIKAAKKYLSKGVVAIDLAGAEALYPNELYFEEFKLADELGVPYIIHAGEASDYRSVDSALDLNARRIGHGIHALENENTINRLKETRTPIEVCPKSNLDTKAINDIHNFRLKELLDKGVIVTLNTDNPTVSNTTLKKQYMMLEEMGLSIEEAYRIAVNTIESSFLSKKEKEELKQYLK